MFINQHQRCSVYSLLKLISSLVGEFNSSPNSLEVSHGGFQMSQMHGEVQRRATGGMGTASGSNGRASMYLWMYTACAYKEFSSVPLIDIENSLQEVFSQTGTPLIRFSVHWEKPQRLNNILIAFFVSEGVLWQWILNVSSFLCWWDPSLCCMFNLGQMCAHNNTVMAH